MCSAVFVSTRAGIQCRRVLVGSAHAALNQQQAAAPQEHQGRCVTLVVRTRSQEGWLELDAYYTGASRGVDPSDAMAPGAKPEGVLPSDSAVDLTLPQANPTALKTPPADDGHGHVVRYVLLPSCLLSFGSGVNIPARRVSWILRLESPTDLRTHLLTHCILR